MSAITFFDSSFHTIAVGTVLSPILKKVKGSSEKFAFVLSVSSLQLILLIPIATAYLGYMVTLVTNNIKNKGIAESAYTIVVKSVLAIGVTLFELGFGRFRIGKAVEETEEFTEAHLAKEEAAGKSVEEYPQNSKNLIIPVVILLVTTIFFFWWTGKNNAASFFEALSSAKFSVSIFSGIMLTLFLTTLYFLIQKISLAEIEAHLGQPGL